MKQIGTITKDAVKDWRDTLLAFRVKVDRKYGASFGGRDLEIGLKMHRRR